MENKPEKQSQTVGQTQNSTRFHLHFYERSEKVMKVKVRSNGRGLQ